MAYELSSEEQETRQTYDNLAPIWNDICIPHYKDSFWCCFTSLLKGERVLDVGCGTARDAELVLSEGFGYTGIDFSEEMLAVGRQNFAKEISDGTVMLKQMNMCELALAPDSFDGFLAIASLMHVPRQNLGVVIKEICRVIKRGGAGFVATPHGTYEGMYEGNDPTLESGNTLSICWLPEQLVPLFENNGFAVIDLEIFDYMIICMVQKS